jgi:hypothetical protein
MILKSLKIITLCVTGELIHLQLSTRMPAVILLIINIYVIPIWFKGPSHEIFNMFFGFTKKSVVFLLDSEAEILLRASAFYLSYLQKFYYTSCKML